MKRQFKITTSTMLLTLAGLGYASEALDCPNGPNTCLPWVSVLVAQVQAPEFNDQASTPLTKDIDAYALNLYNLAPNAKQIHLSVKPNGAALNFGAAPTPGAMITLIQALRKNYSQTPDLLIGFHPDNFYSDIGGWVTQDGTRCSAEKNANWQCAMQASIDYMNLVNQDFQPFKKNAQYKGFDIFSVEQSYVEVDSTMNLAQEKACLNAGASANCPLKRKSLTNVSYGYVAPSCGGPDQYGINAFDFGYPQFYNLYHNYTFNDSQAPFPPSTLPSSQKGTYVIVDADLQCKLTNSHNGELPNFICKKEDGQTLTSSYQKADSSIPASYLAWIMGNKYAIEGNTNFPCNLDAEIFVTLSGEPEFLGGRGWTIAKINQFHSELMQNLQNSQKLSPSAQGLSREQINNMRFAIWQFQPIINNNIEILSKPIK